MRFARKIESSFDSDSSDKNGACHIYSSENHPFAVTEVTSPTAWRTDVTAERNGYAAARFRTFVAAHRKQVESEAKKALL